MGAGRHSRPRNVRALSCARENRQREQPMGTRRGGIWDCRAVVEWRVRTTEGLGRQKGFRRPRALLSAATTGRRAWTVGRRPLVAWLANGGGQVTAHSRPSVEKGEAAGG